MELFRIGLRFWLVSEIELMKLIYVKCVNLVVKILKNVAV